MTHYEIILGIMNDKFPVELSNWEIWNGCIYVNSKHEMTDI